MMSLNLLFKKTLSFIIILVKLFLKLIALLFIVMVGLFFAFFIWSEISDKPHSDKELQQFFYKHEAEFNKLVHDISKIPGEYDSSNTHRGKLEKQLDVIAHKNDDHSITLIAYGTGMAFSTSTYKGYVYSIKPLHPIFDSLDSEPFAYERKISYKKINSNWYLYYISFP